MKNIPITPRNAYLKKLIEKTENAIKRMRWKAFFFERNKEKDVNCSETLMRTTTMDSIQENICPITTTLATSNSTCTT